MKRTFFGLLLLAAIASPTIAQQSSPTDHGAHHPEGKAAASASPSVELTDGEVRRVDKGAKKITLRHATIKSLDMPPMTMVFQVKDTAMLDQVKVGDKIKFAAEDVKGAITLTRMEMAK